MVDVQVTGDPSVAAQASESWLRATTRLSRSGRKLYCKRCFDVMLASAVVVFALPLMGIVALLIKLASPGPVMFFQVREGLDGVPFRMYKFRTMHVDAERRLQVYLAENPDQAAHWKRFFKLRNDPRIIPVLGKILRQSSLDELPQLFNVLKGEMSIVGPRPFPEYHLEAFDPEFRKLRRLVLPGITGLWQTSARSDGDLDVQRSLDTEYVMNWSLKLDLKILFATIAVVLFQRGAY